MLGNHRKPRGGSLRNCEGFRIPQLFMIYVDRSRPIAALCVRPVECGERPRPAGLQTDWSQIENIISRTLERAAVALLRSVFIMPDLDLDLSDSHTHGIVCWPAPYKHWAGVH
ncbi:hypothetical protein RRG08_017109 [Elysia crispata]|uniref:Uncharacterized protein n=1 Tax=Elysia crispata TaxID=231223 RepID=A0AAE0ZQ58_9GAST|nr:hypothetical protein RRG08_017109 [Elysia crispata]